MTVGIRFRLLPGTSPSRSIAIIGSLLSLLSLLFFSVSLGVPCSSRLDFLRFPLDPIQSGRRHGDFDLLRRVTVRPRCPRPVTGSQSVAATQTAG